MMKTLIVTLAAAAFLAPAALAAPAEAAGRLARELSQAERNGAWAQGSPADHYEDRLDRREDKLDRRESVRDEAFDRNRRDVREDAFDRRESRRDKAENRVDRAH
jgi:hypothetical protein